MLHCDNTYEGRDRIGEQRIEKPVRSKIMIRSRASYFGIWNESDGRFERLKFHQQVYIGLLLLWGLQLLRVKYSDEATCYLLEPCLLSTPATSHRKSRKKNPLGAR